MRDLLSIPELVALAAPSRVIRIPPDINVPLTTRVSRILDCPTFARLARISQLGLVGHVYPGAQHSRREHCLGVYRTALLFCQRLIATKRFRQIVTRQGVERFLLASLLHDVAHWPYCHPIEDMQLETVDQHEQRAEAIMCQSQLGDLIREDWDTEPSDVARLLADPADEEETVLASLINGPIDCDKMDYLQRDSLHAGVPYGRNFDVGRLISSLIIHPELPRLAITDKGRTAAEMMVFSRYIMFSEVYWHHAVRAATAMLQRAVYCLGDRIDLRTMMQLDDNHWESRLLRMSEGTLAAPLVEGLFGTRRRLYKRVAQFGVLEDPELHRRLAGRPYRWLAQCSERLAGRLSKYVNRSLSMTDVIIDAPPQKLEVDINVEVISVEADAKVRTLGQVSPVAATLARQQFDHYVKRVRVFVDPSIREQIETSTVIQQLNCAIDQCDAN